MKITDNQLADIERLANTTIHELVNLVRFLNEEDSISSADDALIGVTLNVEEIDAMLSAVKFGTDTVSAEEIQGICGERKSSGHRRLTTIKH